MSVDLAELVDLTGTTASKAKQQLSADIAEQYVSDHLADEACFSDAGLANLELLLAAHFLEIAESKYDEEKIGDASRKRNKGYALAIGFETTRWGLAAISLDCSGKLKTMGKGNQKPLFQSFGTDA